MFLISPFFQLSLSLFLSLFLSLSLFLTLSSSLSLDTSLSSHTSLSFHTCLSLFSSFSLFTMTMATCDVSVCVLCGVSWCCGCIVQCGVCARFVLAMKKKAVCTFKTLPCVLSKRSRVCVVNTLVSHETRSFSRHTRERFQSTHGSVLSPFLSLPFPCRLSLCSMTMTMIALSAHAALTYPEKPECVGFGPFVGWRNACFTQKPMCPRIPVQASCYLE